MNEAAQHRYPGLPAIVDGSEAVARHRLADWRALQEMAGVKGAPR